MVATRRSRGDTASSRRAAPSAGVVLERRRRRSLTPLVFSLLGLLVGTVVADVAILAVLGESLLASAWPEGALSDPWSWWAALRWLGDPGIALASIVVGGLPGAICGRALAIRRLRSDRLDALSVQGASWPDTANG